MLGHKATIKLVFPYGLFDPVQWMVCKKLVASVQDFTSKEEMRTCIFPVMSEWHVNSREVDSFGFFLELVEIPRIDLLGYGVDTHEGVMSSAWRVESPIAKVLLRCHSQWRCILAD